MSLHTCPSDNCGRQFLDVALLADHADSVHTFDDIRAAVSDAVRDKWGQKGDRNAIPAVPYIWTWVQDLSSDWVVFQYENGEDCSLQKASYTIDDAGNVTLGDAVEVMRRTVYDPVPPDDAAPTTTGS